MPAPSVRGRLTVAAVFSLLVIGIAPPWSVAMADPRSPVDPHARPALVYQPEPGNVQARSARPGRKQATFSELVSPGTSQVVRTVSSTTYCRQVFCTVTQAWQRVDGVWRLVREFRSTIGPAGWDKRREGDGRSPTGVLRIKTVFSTTRRPIGDMTWRQRRPTSAVLATPGRLYNTWVEQPGRRDGARPSMRFGFVLDYNRVRMRSYVGPKPMQARGSGIFYHTSSSPQTRWEATAGCTKVGRPQQLRWLLEWLRPGAAPRVVQNR